MLISNSIVSLSKRSFARRLRTASYRVAVEKSALTRLNNQLDELYELLYDNYSSMTASDYDSFKDNLSILLSTLYRDYRRSSFRNSLAESIDSLQSNIAALEEMDSDIRNYKIRLPLNPRYAKVVGMAKAL